jgi:hypothetical protein
MENAQEALRTSRVIGGLAEKRSEQRAGFAPH